MKKRLLAVLMTACLLIGLLPCAAEAAGTFGIQSLRVEGDSAAAELSAGGACTLAVALYDIEGGMLGMGQTAVSAGSGSYTVKLPVEALERFTAKAFLLDANSAPLCECYVLDRSGQYSITGLTVADGQAAASVSAGADCQLMLRFLSDDGQSTLDTLYAPVESGAETVTADLPQDHPCPPISGWRRR